MQGLGTGDVTCDPNGDQARWRLAADWARRARSASFFACFAAARFARISACSASERLRWSTTGVISVGSTLGSATHVVGLQEVADDRRGWGLAGDGRRQHDARGRDTVALDDPRQHRLELIGRRVVGVVAELGDAVGQAGVGEDGGDRLHAAVDAARLHRRPDAVSVERIDERVETLAVIVVERLDRRGEFLVGGGLERSIEQAERLHPVLHLIHGPRRYLLHAATGPLLVPRAPPDFD